MLEPFERPGGYWKRLVLGALSLIVLAASATAFAAFREIDRVVEAFDATRRLPLDDYLAQAEQGKPQTIMLIGSDRRGKGARDGSYGARSDTIMLVRLDPSKKATALLSLPRDLKVRIPGHGTDKLNAAYSEGGPELTLRTVKQLTGLAINHVININFRGFRKAVDKLGCIYVDVDRRYFNDNSGYGPDYATINVKQGYQRLCGYDALDYVRFRHEDTDIVRSARQQEFLRQVKQQIGVGRLFEERSALIKIFGQYTESDLRGTKQVLRLLKLAIASARHPIREVHFKGRIGASLVTASDGAMKRLTREFLGVESTSGPRGKLRPKKNEPRRRKRRKLADHNLENAADAGREQALQAVGQNAKIPVYYPKLRTRGALFTGPPRVYGIRVGGRKKFKKYNSYRIVIKKGLVGEYYGVQGTVWRDPPILRDPSEKRRIGGREFELHYDGDRLRLVAWRTKKAVYWVSNTLLQTLSEQQMLGIAKSTRTL